MNEKSLFEDILQKRGFIVNPQDFNKFENHCIEIRNFVYKNFEDEMERIGIHESIIWDRLYSFYFGLGLIEILNKILESEDLTKKDLKYFINKSKKAYKVRYFVYHLLFSDLSNYTYVHRKELLNEH